MPGTIRTGTELVDPLKVAVQVLLAFMVTCPSVQSESSLQPSKVELESAVAVRVTTVPLL
jgi:hypothetical protein